jgi:hypothetical protein
MVFEMDKNNNIKNHGCTHCGLTFCLFGCNDPHQGSTCE